MAIWFLNNTFGPRHRGIKPPAHFRMKPLFTKPRAVFGTDTGGIHGFCITPLSCRDSRWPPRTGYSSVAMGKPNFKVLTPIAG